MDRPLEPVLNQQIGEYLGYTVRPEPGTGHFTFWKLYDPSGIHVEGGVGVNEAAAWSNLPRWVYSVDYALMLFVILPEGFTPRLVRILTPRDSKMGFWWKANILHNDTMDDVVEYLDESAAYAISMAWWLFKHT